MSTDPRNSLITSSRQVNWLTVHQFVAPVLAAAGSWPMVGTPAWCALDDDHPAKIAAIYDAAQHWALRVDTCQAALSQTSHDISAAEDWSALATEIPRRSSAISDGAYIPREVA
jgi:hypothetical protein